MMSRVIRVPEKLNLNRQRKFRDLAVASQAMRQLDMVNKEVLTLAFRRRDFGKEVELNATATSYETS